MPACNFGRIDCAVHLKRIHVFFDRMAAFGTS